LCPVREIRRPGCVSQDRYGPDLCRDGGRPLVGGGKQHKVSFREAATFIGISVWLSLRKERLERTAPGHRGG